MLKRKGFQDFINDDPGLMESKSIEEIEKINVKTISEYEDEINPCITFCYTKFGKTYSPECEDRCRFAKVIKELRNIKLEIRKIQEKIILDDKKELDVLYKYVSKIKEKAENTNDKN